MDRCHWTEAELLLRPYRATTAASAGTRRSPCSTCSAVCACHDAGLRRGHPPLHRRPQARGQRSRAASEPRPDLRTARATWPRPTRTGIATSTCSTTACRLPSDMPGYLERSGLREPEPPGQQLQRKGEVVQRRRLRAARPAICGPTTPTRSNGCSTCTTTPSGRRTPARTLEQLRKPAAQRSAARPVRAGPDRGQGPQRHRTAADRHRRAS